MAGLFTSLGTVAGNMDAQRYGLDVTGQNIANLNTEGYVRRRLELAERPPVNGSGGVQVVGVRATRDAFVEARLRGELPAQARDEAMAQSLAVVESSLGSAGESIDGSLSAFFNAFSALSVDPQSAVARDGVVLQSSRLATGFNDLARRLDESAAQADADIRVAVDQVNALASKVAELNRAIGDANGGDTEGLRDELGVALQDLSRLTNVSVITRPEGTVDLAVGSGRALVVGTSVYALTTGTVPVTGRATIIAGEYDITRELTGGTIGGRLEVRDALIPRYQQRLDQLAYDVATQVNARHAAGYDALGNTGQPLFVAPAAVSGAARAMAVDPAVLADNRRVAASGTGATGDNAAARAIANLRTANAASGGSATFTQAWSQLVFVIGSDSADAKTRFDSRKDVVSAIERLRDSVSGVSLDEEASRLIQYQRAYEANARFFSTIDSAIVTLLNMVGVR